MIKVSHSFKYSSVISLLLGLLLAGGIAGCASAQTAPTETPDVVATYVAATMSALQPPTSTPDPVASVVAGTVAALQAPAQTATPVIDISRSFEIVPAAQYTGETTDANGNPVIVADRQSDGGFVLGSPTAPVTIVEFSDFRCSHCQDYFPDLERFKEEFVATGMARFEYRMFRTSDPTGTTAMMAQCADMQRPGAFWDAHSVIFQLTSAGNNANLFEDVARTANLNLNDLINCVSRLPETDTPQFDTDTEFGLRLGVSGTPAVMVRYGDSEPQWIQFEGRTYDRGAVPYEVLAAVVNAAQ